MAGHFQAKSFHGGMNKDLDYSLLKENQYIDAQNYKLISDDTANGFTFENAEGNSIWLDATSISGILSNYSLVGHCYIQPYLVLFYTNVDKDRSPSAGTSKIVRLTIDRDEIQEAEVIYDDSAVFGSLDLSTTYPVKAIGHYEADDNIKVYWTDGYNDVKAMNIMDPDLATYSADKLDLTPNFPILAGVSIRPTFSSYINGNIDCGSVQYAYQYYIPSGPTTVWSPASPMIQIPDVYSKQSIKMAGGDQDEDSGYGVAVDIEIPSTDFTKIRVVAIEYSSLNAIPTIRLFEDRDIIPSTTYNVIVNDTGDLLSEITYDEFLVQSNTTFKARDLAIKDNYLFAGNTREESFDVDIDCRVYRHDATGVATVYESDLVSSIDIDHGSGGATGIDYDAVPDTHDCINLYNKSVHTSVGDEATNTFIYQANGTTLGAEGLNIKLEVVTDVTDIMDLMGVSNDSQWNASTFLYEPGERSWQRNEVYRLGVIFRNAKMQPSPVKWMCDFKFPSTYEDSTDFAISYYSAPNTLRRRLGLKVTYVGDYAVEGHTGIGTAWEDTAADHMELVMVPRGTNDRSILAQGIVQPTYQDSTGSNFNFPYHEMATEYYGTSLGYSNPPVTGNTALVRLISPEIAFNKNLEHQSDDFIHYLGYFDHTASNRTVTNDSGGVDPMITYDKVFNHTSSGVTDFTSAKKLNVDDATLVGFTSDAEYNTVVDSKVYFPYSIEELATYAGGTTSHLVMSPAVSLGSSWWTAAADRIALANYKRDVFETQYGGIDYYSRQSNTYIIASDLITPTPKASPVGSRTRTESYEGDTFIDWFFYNNVCTDLDALSTDTCAATFLFPVETSISLSHRLDDGILRNIGFTDAILTQETAGTWESDAVDGTTRTYEQETALYQYNPSYSQLNYASFHYPATSNYEAISEHPTRIKRSELKINGELIDSFTKFKANNFIDLNGQYGELNNLEIFKNNLYYWQDTGFGVASVNTRSLVEDGNVGVLAVGTGGILERVDYLSDTIGNQNQFGIAKSRGALYWADNNKNELFKFTNDVSSVSKLGGIQTWINEQGKIGKVNAVYDEKYNDVIFTITFARLLDAVTVSGDYVDDMNIVPSTGISTVVDHNVIISARFADDTIQGNKSVIEYTSPYWNFVEDAPYGTADSNYYATIDGDSTNTYTLTFNEVVNSFVSFNSFIPVKYIQLDTNFLSANDYTDLYIHNTNDASRCTYFGTTYDSEFTTVFNKDFPYTKVWDSVKWFTESVDSDDANQFKDTFDTLTIYNDYQHTGDRDLYYKGDSAPATRPTEIVRRDRTFSMAIPRNIVDIDVSSNPDITDSGNWDETQIFKERIRDKYIVVNTTYDNTNDYTFSVPFVSATYRKSTR